MRVAAAMLATLTLAATAPPGAPPPAAPSGAPAAAPAAPSPAAQADLVPAGRRLFADPSLSGSGKISCATCHADGRTDNRTYHGPNVVRDGTADGRSTPTLLGSRDTAPYTWAGGKTLEEAIKAIVADRMKGKEPTASQVEALAAYVRSLRFPPNARLNNDGTPGPAAPEAARRGHQAFLKAACDICHDPPIYSKAGNEDIGSGGSFSVPSLRGVAGTAPYFHDGRFATLRDVIPVKLALLGEMGFGEPLSEQEIADLIAFLEIL
jgi:cytochrome c peroxidase